MAQHIFDVIEWSKWCSSAYDFLIFMLSRACIILSLCSVFSAAHESGPSHTTGRARPLPAPRAATAVLAAVAAAATAVTAAAVAAAAGAAPGARAPRTVTTAKAATRAPDSESN